MEIEQTTELTYTKVEDIDKKINEILDMVTDSKPESSTTLKELVNEIKSDTDNLETKVDTILENQASGGNFDTTNLENQINEIKTNFNSLNTNIDEMNNDITTTNSNVATNKNNINSIKSTVESIQDKMPSTIDNNSMKQKLDEILRYIKKEDGAEEFTDDPFKLDLEYSERLELHRNPSNYDFIEINGDREIRKYILILMANCEGTTFDYNITFTFTCTEQVNLSYFTSFDSPGQTFQAGTHTVNKSGKDITIKNNKILFNYYKTGGNMTLHYLKFEIFGNNAIIIPKRNKFKVCNCLNKISINKVENNNGYYLVLDSNDTLTPDLLKQTYTLGASNVRDICYTFNFYESMNQKYIIAPYLCYVSDNYYFNSDYGNGYNVYEYTSLPCLDCSVGYFDKSYMHGCSTMLYSTLHPCAYTFKTHQTVNDRNTVSTSLSYTIANTIAVNDLNINDNTEKRACILTNFNGINYLYYYNNILLELGYGKYPTAYFDKENPLKINAYLNDNGYCVKYIIILSSDKKSAQIISKKIIGTYDAYFETNSDIYLVEKGNELYMFKK